MRLPEPRIVSPATPAATEPTGAALAPIPPPSAVARRLDDRVGMILAGTDELAAINMIERMRVARAEDHLRREAGSE